MKRVVEIALAQKLNKGLIFGNRTGSTVNDILPDDKENEAFKEIDWNITGVDWEAEIQEPAEHVPKLNNNKYVLLAGEEDNEDNDTKITRVENDGKITGVCHDEKITGVDIDHESTESEIIGATEKLDEMALVEEAIAEVEQDITEGADLIAAT